ncbi:translocation/assembly module TamB domain-containing protein, partial [Thermodesulfobacteriota bacterium]
KWAGYVSLSFGILLLTFILKWESISYYGLSKVARYYAEREHVVLDIGRISGNPLSKTTFETLSLRSETGQPQKYHLKAQSLTCTYNLWDLRDGYDVFLQGLSCTASAPELSYDLRSETPQEQSAVQSEHFILPPVIPRVDVHSGTVILTGSDWDVEARGINSSLRSDASVPELYLEIEKFMFNQQSITRIDTGVTSLLRYSDYKLIVDSLNLGEQEISASGVINLSRIDENYADFDSGLVFDESKISVSGTIDNKLLKARVRTDNFAIGELQKRLGGSGWDISGIVNGEADLVYNFAAVRDLSGSFSFEAREGQVHGVEIDTASLNGSFDQEFFSVLLAEIKTSGNHIYIRDAAVPTSLLQDSDTLTILAGVEAKFGVEITDFVKFLQLTKVDKDIFPEDSRPDSTIVNGYLKEGTIYLDDTHAKVNNSNLFINQAKIPIPATMETFESVPIELTAEFNSSNIERIISGLSGGIPLNGKATADINISGSIKELRGSLSIAGEDLGYKELQLGTLALQGELRVIQEKLGKIKVIQLIVNDMTQTNDSGTLSLLAPAKVSWQQEMFSMDANVQLDGQGEADVSVKSTSVKEISAKIITRNLDSKGWLGNFLDKKYFFNGADIEAFVTGLPKNPQIELKGSVDGAGGKGIVFPIAGSFALQYSPKGIEISEFSWKSHEKNQLELTGFLPYDPLAPSPFLDGELTFNGHIDFPALEGIGLLLEPLGISRGSLSMEINLTGSWKQPLGRLFFKADGIEPPNILKQYNDSPLNITCDLTADPDTIVLNSANLISNDYSAQAKGSWQHGLSVKELLQKRITDLRGEVSADVIVDFKNMNFLRNKLAWLRRLDGSTQVKLNVSGSASDPDLRGSFIMQDGEVSHTFNFPMLSSVNLQGEFDAQSLTISSMQGEVGGSSVILNGKINRGQQDIVDVSLQIEGKNVLLFRNNDLRMRGDVQLEASGPLEKLMIKGTTGLTGGYYTRNIDFLEKIGSSSTPVSKKGDFLFSFEEQPLKNAILDIEITTVEPFRIRNNIVRGTLRPELFLKGTGELPFLVGTIYIDPSRILLPSGRLQVQSGLIRFLESDPDRPQLDLLANSKVQGYDINVVTQGPLDDPVITLSSSPALPNDDLLLLLLTGQPPKQEVTSGTQGRSATNVMVYLGRDFLTKWLEDESGTSEETILDRFELDYGRGVTRSGEQTIESTFRLSELNEEKKRVYYLSGEKDRYDAFNYGLRMVFRFE